MTGNKNTTELETKIICNTIKYKTLTANGTMEKKIHLEAPSERWSTLEREKQKFVACVLYDDAPSETKNQEKKSYTHSTKHNRKKN